MPQIWLAWLGRRHRHRHRHRPFHRELAAGRFPLHPLCLPSSSPLLAWLGPRYQHLPSQREQDTGRFQADFFYLMLSSSSIQNLDLQSSGTKGASVAPVLQSMFCAVGGSGKIPGVPSVSIAGATSAFVSHTSIGTLAGSHRTPVMSSITKPGLTRTSIFRASFSTNAAEFTECKDDSSEAPFKIKLGNANELSCKIHAEVDYTDSKVRNFQKRYKELVRPLLVSRCLIAPHGLCHPSTVFVHRQTYKIFNHHATYISCFDIMGYEDGIKDEELKILLGHMVQKKVYVIEDWDLTISTIEMLVYDHGLKGPEDGTDLVFYKGECDASFDGANTANLSFMIWNGNRIVYSEVYQGVSCTSATQAESFAAFALLSKANELKIQKLLLYSDSKSICKVLSGELGIGLKHAHRNLYLMLRSMKRHFSRLVIMWKPRELMVFADDLAKASEYSLYTPSFPKDSMQRWSSLLQGLPVFRIERTEETNKKIRKFGKTQLDEAYGRNKDSIFFIEVEDELKYDCLLGLKQSMSPAVMRICINDFNDKPDVVQKEFMEFVNISSETKIGRSSVFNGKFKDSFMQKRLVVVYDATIPKDIYHIEDAFHVILVNPDHRTSMRELKIPELTALAFIYFRGVQFPLNDSTS